MPRWEIHLSVASMAVLVISTGYALGTYQSGLSILDIDKGIHLILGLGLGCAALFLGSVLPDIDGRGRIRWTIGPIFGAFGIIPPFIGKVSAQGISEAFNFIWNEGSSLFLILTVIGYFLIILPLKHRGWMHSVTPGLIYGSAFGSYVFLSTSLGLEVAFLVGTLSILGYLWHLSLDGELSL